MIDPRWIGTVGLALDVIGVCVLFKWSPRTSVPVGLADGTEARIKTGGKDDTRLSRTGLVLILIGFMLQIGGLWAPSIAASVTSP
jgi:hypothetical protein